MKEIQEKQAYTDACGEHANPRSLAADFSCCGVVLKSLILPLETKNQRNSTVRSWGIARGDDFSFSQASSSVISVMHPSSGVSTRCGGGPRFERATIRSNDSKGISGLEFFNAEPTNVSFCERVADDNGIVSENYFGLNHKSPEQEVEGNAVDQRQISVAKVICSKELSGNNDLYNQDNSKVNPTTGWPIDVFFGHVSKTTPSTSEASLASYFRKAKSKNDSK